MHQDCKKQITNYCDVAVHYYNYLVLLVATVVTCPIIIHHLNSIFDRFCLSTGLGQVDRPTGCCLPIFLFFILYLLKREKDTCEWLLLIFMRLRNQLTVRRTRHGHLPPLLHFLILFSLFLSFGFIFTYLMDWCWDLVWSAPCSRWSYRGFRSEHSLKRPTPANQTFP